MKEDQTCAQSQPCAEAGSDIPLSLAEQHRIGKRDGPSQHGAYVGQALVALAEAGRAADPACDREMCATCAFRPDCMTNQMAATGLVAIKCAIGADPDPFGCHHALKDGTPTRLCAGYYAAQRAPFEAMKAIMFELTEKLGSMSGPDAVRAAFDEWVAGVDPDGKLDDYARGRLYLRARKTTTPLDAHDTSERNDRTRDEPLLTALSSQQGADDGAGEE